MTRWRAMALVVAALAVWVAFGGCFVSGFDLVSATAVGGSGAADGGANRGGDGGVGPACSHATWPEAPVSSDPGPDDVDFVVVAHALDFGETDLSQGPKIGFDLDNRCTCQGDGASCKEPDWATADHCDGPGGRDNAGAQMFAALSVFDPSFSNQNYGTKPQEGKGTVLVRVRDYNGQANDLTVTMSLHPSPGLGKDPCNGVDPLPAWDGNDRWPVAASSLNGGGGQGGAGGGGAGGGGTGGAGGSACGLGGYDVDDARFVDHNAYVSDWILVANLPEVALLFPTSDEPIPLKLAAGFVSGRIDHQNDGWYLREAVLVGRWRVADFLAMLGKFTSAGMPLCTDHPVYGVAKNAICQYPDIASSLGGPTTPCDAISVGLGFDAWPATIGAVVTGGNTGSLCPPETDPANDSCGP